MHKVGICPGGLLSLSFLSHDDLVFGCCAFVELGNNVASIESSDLSTILCAHAPGSSPSFPHLGHRGRVVLMGCSSFLSLLHDKILSKSSLGEEKVYLAYIFRLWFTIEGIREGA